MPGDGPLLSVVAPALNEEQRLGLLLPDLAGQTREADEVIVVDAGSRDGIVSVAERFPGVVVLSEAPPVAKGRNLGDGALAVTSWSSSTPTCDLPAISWRAC